jgi:hypothetical protein
MGSVQCPYCKQSWQFENLQEFEPKSNSEEQITSLYIDCKNNCPELASHNIPFKHVFFLDYDHTGRILSSEELCQMKRVFFSLRRAKVISP